MLQYIEKKEGNILSLAFVIESFKFHRLKSNRIVQLLFLFALIFNFAMRIIPLGDPDFSRLTEYIVAASSQLTFFPKQSYLVPDLYRESIISIGNIVFLLIRYFAVTVNMCLAALYAGAMNAGFDDYPNEESFRNFFRKLPQILLLALLMLVPYIFSLPFLGIPFYILVSALVFAPLLMIDKNMHLNEAMEQSKQDTYGLKFQMVMSFFVLNFIVSLPRDMLIVAFGQNPISLHLLSAFFLSVEILALGRLWSLFYLYSSRSYRNRRLHLIYEPNDVQRFFTEVNRQSDEDKLGQDSDDDDDDDSLW